MNEMFIDPSSLLPGHIKQVQNGIRSTMLDPTNGSQTAALDQHSHSIKKGLPISPQRLEEGAFIKTERLLTSYAVVSSLNIAMHFDVANS